MLQYILSGLAGIALGIVGLRVWQARAAPAQESNATPLVPATDSLPATAPARTRMLLIGAGGLVAAAVAVFLFRSPDDATVPAGSAAPTAPSSQSLSDVDTMIAKLADRLAKNPADGEGFRMLGWSYVMTGHPDQAVEPYRRALTLLPGRADVHAGLGEALVGTAKGAVTAESMASFDKAIAIDPKEPRARYFLALWQAQNGQEKEALDAWIALANGGPADAPWQADVRRQIAETSGKLGIDVAARLKLPAPAAAPADLPSIDSAAAQAASQLPAGDRQALVDKMVEGLAAKLKANPKDANGWVRLLRSRMVLQQAAQAEADLSLARSALAADKDGLAKVNAAAVQFGVSGAR